MFCALFKLLPAEDKDYLTNNWKSKNISIFHQNVQGLNSKLESLQIVLDELTPDIIVLTEHKIKSSEIDRLNIEKYKLNSYFCRNDTNWGGVVVLGREHLQCTRIAIPNQECLLEEKQFECCATLFTINGFKFVLVGVYRSPNSNVNIFLEKLSALIGSILTKIPNIILAGDFNIDILETNNNPQTKAARVKLKNVLKSFNMSYVVNFPTRVFNGSTSSIDNFLTNLSRKEFKVSGVITLLSDHDGQILELVRVRKAKENSYLTVTKRQFTVENMELFKKLLKSETWDNVFQSLVDRKYDEFDRIFSYYFDIAFPKVKVKSKTSKNNWINNELKDEKREIISNNRYARRTNNLALAKLCRIKNRALKKKLVNTKKDFYDNKIKLSKNIIKTTWKIINVETGNKVSKDLKNIAIRKGNSVLSNPSEISNFFNNYFSTIVRDSPIFLPSTPSSENVIPDHINNQVFINNQNSFRLTHTNEEEVNKIISSFQNKSSCGHDDVPMKLIKFVQKELNKVLVHLINSSFVSSHFPDKLKIAKIVPIYKRDDPMEVGNYRPVSLLPSVSKIYEKVVYLRLATFLESNGLLDNIQHGFRRQKSTITAIVSFIELIIESIDKGEDVVGVFMDLSKAFDSVNHELLLSKLQEKGVKNNSLNWFKSYLTNRKQFVQINHITKSNCEIKCNSNLNQIKLGVPQGSILGPLLFLCYLGSIKDCMHFSPTTSLCLYADDSNLKISGKTEEEIETVASIELANLEEFFDSHNLTLNSDKTKCVSFRTKQNKKSINPSLEIKGKVIELEEEIKFLGVTLDCNLTWDSHSKYVLSTINSGLFAIRRMSSLCNVEALKLIYFSHIQSHIAYGICIYGATKDKNLIEILKIQKLAIRAILKLNYNESVKAHFSQLNILTVYGLYILECIMFVKNQHQNFTNLKTHNYNTRHKHDYTVQNHNLEIYKHNTVYVGNSFLKYVPADIKKEQQIQIFKKKLKGYLIGLSLYSIDEYKLNYSYTKSRLF